jgi:hypothetical protein
LFVKFPVRDSCDFPFPFPLSSPSAASFPLITPETRRSYVKIVDDESHNPEFLPFPADAASPLHTLVAYLSFNDLSRMRTFSDGMVFGSKVLV